MEIKKIRLNDDYLRIGIFCISLSIIYLFIITPLRLNSVAFNFFQDLTTRYAWGLFYKTAKSPDITIIVLDDATLRRENLKWPWPRAKFAQLIHNLSLHKPKVITMDISFVGKSTHSTQDDDIFAQAMMNAGNVLLASYIGIDDVPASLSEPLTKAARDTGFVNKVKDNYSIVRLARAAVMQGKKIEYSLEIKGASFYKGDELAGVKISGRNLIVGAERLTTLSWDGTFPIKYRYRLSNFDCIAASDIFSGNYSPSLIKDKFIIIGPTAEVLHDVHLTPLGIMPGVLINANVTANLLDRELLHKPSVIYIFLFFILLSFIAAYMGLRYPFWSSFLKISILAFFMFFISIFAFKLNIDFDTFGIFILLYTSLASSRIYLSIKSYIEKSNMLRLLITDVDTGLYNIYYIMVKLQQQLEKAKDKKGFPSLIIVGFSSTALPLSSIEPNEHIELMAGLASIIREKTKFLNSSVARTAEFEFGIIVAACDKKLFDEIVESFYQQLSDIKLFLPKVHKRFELDTALGACYGCNFEERSAELMLYAAQEALSRAKTLSDRRCYIFDGEKEKLSAMEEETPSYASEGRLIGFVIEDLKRKNRELLGRIKELTQDLSNLKDAYLTITASLVKALEEKDIYTAGHSERVAAYAILLADKLNIATPYKETIQKAALLHDVGKIGVPDNILRKKGALTDDEREMMHRHEIESAYILEPATFLKDAIPLILHHHEKYDGSGYPHGLTAERIPLGSRIIAIGDVFDAMTSGRGYNQPLTTEEAFANLRKDAGKHFDPGLVEKFIEVIKESSGKINF